MKKKIAIFLAAVALICSTGTVAYAKGGLWKRIVAAVDALLGDGGIPCWSAAQHGGDHDSWTYVDCASCLEKTGEPKGGSGTC